MATQSTVEKSQAITRRSVDLLSQRHDVAWLCVGTLAVSALTFLFGLWGSGGRLAPPLDDTFIHLQYARQLAGGHPFQYNTGDPPSSGDSAFIYPFLLAPAYLLGLGGMKALLYADALNLAAHLVAVVLLYRLLLKVAGRPVALLGALFLLLDGRVNWMFLTGMETGLYTAGLVAFFWLWLREVPKGRFGWLAAVGSLVALLRTEGHILMSLVCLLTLVYLWRTGRLRPVSVLLLAPILVGLAPYAVNQALTGYWQFNTALSKSHWYVPYWPLHNKLSLTVGHVITAVKDTYLGLDIGRSPFPVLALPVAVVGAAAALNNGRYRALHVLLIATFLGGVALAHLLPPIHFYRYHQPYDFIYLTYIAFGIAALATFASRIVQPSGNGTNREPSVLSPQHSALRWAAVGVTLLLLPQFVTFLFDFSNSTRDIYYQQMTFSEWVRRYTPDDARIGVNDIGAHKYLGDRYMIDLIGLTDNSLTGAHFGGWGAVYDVLARLPVERRPQYILIHPDVALNNDESVRQGLMEPFYQINIQNPTITAGPTEMLYKMNWDFDALNVGDLADERWHSYKPVGREPSLPDPKAIVTSASYEKKGPVLTDSGRRHTGWEEFSVRSVPGLPLTVGSRARLNTNAEQKVLVWANGQQVGVWEQPNERESLWQEYEYTIPAQFITGDHTTIRIDATFDPGGPGFASYRYWFYGP